MKPASTLEFNVTHYYFVQRYKHNLCLYHSGSTLLIVEFNEQADPSHRYFVVGMSFIDGYHESGWDSDGTEYSVGPCTAKNQTGYAIPVSFDEDL